MKRYYIPAYTSEVAEKINRGIRFIARAYTTGAARLIARALNEMEERKQVDADCSGCWIKNACGECTTKRRTK